jgi:DNA repair exonuclease SbcCD ATPase subunit
MKLERIKARIAEVEVLEQEAANLERWAEMLESEQEPGRGFAVMAQVHGRSYGEGLPLPDEGAAKLVEYLRARVVKLREKVSRKGEPLEAVVAELEGEWEDAEAERKRLEDEAAGVELEGEGLGTEG